jgi:orotidine-5'-phosphate decarboxylase
MTTMSLAKEKLIVALDVDNADHALEIFTQLRETAGMFKVGMQLFTAAGPDLVRNIIGRGGRIFLDLKYHDIPNTVALAAVEAARLGVSIFNIHSSGGLEMMKQARAAVENVVQRESLSRPKIIGVTVLTSIDKQALARIGIDDAPSAVVKRLAAAAAEAGLDGVVASAQEIELIRESVPQSDFIIVTPGIRPESEAAGDQKRIMTPAGAIRGGADYLVVGRPILSASDPVAAAQNIIKEIEAAITA